MSELDVHLIGICGTGMGSFAGLLQAEGHRVRGSDQNVYPPMSDKLAAWGIPVAEGYRPENLEPRPDLVVVGNVIRRDNPEARAAMDGGIEYLSFPEALGKLFLGGRRSLVVAGTHGKTTTTSLLAWLLASAGRDPGLLVGGVPANFDEGFRRGSGPHFVIEGDEYDTAFFDKRPKFLHYQPMVAIMTSIELDHVDIYPNVEAIEARFDELAALVPEDGRILACASFPRVLARRPAARATWETYSARPESGADWTVGQSSAGPEGLRFELVRQGENLGELLLPMSGRHNLENAVAAAAVALHEGLSFDELREGMASFEGIARRQTLRGEVDGVRVIDDFAHHPTAVKETLEGLRSRYSGRLIAIFEPRTATSARKHFQEAYAGAFGAADQVLIAPVGRKELPEDERLDVARLARDIARSGPSAEAPESIEAIVGQLSANARPGDTLVFMSNGGFGGIHDRMLAALRTRGSASSAAPEA